MQQALMLAMSTLTARAWSQIGVPLLSAAAAKVAGGLVLLLTLTTETARAGARLA
jgi:hypothetical protein